jgi:ABC-type branched-subunit amino acid transport system substrate-binding protein
MTTTTTAKAKDSPLTANNGLKSFALIAALFLLLSWLRLDPGSDNASTDLANRDATPGAEAGDDGSGTIDPSNPGAGAAGPGTNANATGPAQADGPRPGLACNATKNGGRTDTGVSANKIELATTAVLDGEAKSLLADSVTAMKTVVDKVNKSGGICGRILDLRVVNDGFQDQRGQAAIKSFIDEGVFALPVVPSAEGLGAAILSGEIKKAKIPVVGTDGMRQEQYGDPYVWPVASATVTAMRVMAKYGATNRGAKTFGIVWDQKYKFGREGKDAFIEQVKKMGFTVAANADQPLNPDLPSYGNESARFSQACGSAEAPTCDMVAMLLLPDTATKWLQKKPPLGRLFTSGAQTLFTDRFAQSCVSQVGGRCHGFAVWTGYNPPIGPLKTLPGVASYVSDVSSVKSDIDINNQFIEGAYLGMSLFVKALQDVGPDLTRARLAAALDRMDFKTDLASQLSWRPGNHAANVRSQAFSMTVSNNTFRGWSNENTGFLLDPAHGG